MKNLAKRAMSVVLSAMLLLGVLPSFALSVSADSSDSLIGQYFSTDNVWYDAVTDSGSGLGWTDGEFPKYQSDTGFTYLESINLKINNTTIFQDVDADTGITFAFKYYSTEDDNYRHLLSLGNSEETGTNNHFYISSNPSWFGESRGLTIGYVDGSGIEHIKGYADGGPTFEANKIYNVYITITKDSATYYINGGKYDLVSQDNSEGYFENFLNAISTYDDNYIGMSRWGDPNFNGYIKNLRIYGKALDEMEVYEEEYGIDVSTLKNTFSVSSLYKSTNAFNTVPYHMDSAVTTASAYSNVVYAPQGTTVFSGDGTNDNKFGEIGRISFKVAIPLNTVLAYDGVNDVKAPMVLETQCNDTEGTAHIIHYLGNYSTKFILTQDWQGYWYDYTIWGAGSTASVDDFAYYDDNNYNESENSQRDDNSRLWWNTLTFNGDFSDGSYYYSESNLKYYGHTSYYLTVGGRQHKYSDIQSYGNYYVLNYKPIYDLLDEASTFYYSSVIARDWMYTEESYNKCMLALYLLGRCNPKNYDYSTSTLEKVEQCAADIKTAERLYSEINLEKKTFTVNFKNIDGDVVDTRNIVADTELGALPANTDARHIANSDTHYTYSWGSNVSASTVVHDDTDFDEKSAVKDCKYVESYTAPTEDFNGYKDYTCSVCGYTDPNRRVYDATDWDAYDSAVLEYNDIISDGMYGFNSPESRELYETTVEAAKIDKNNTVPQTAINDATTKILEAKSLLEDLEFLVEHRIYIDGEFSSYGGGGKKYGTTFAVEVDEDDIPEGASIYKWTCQYDNGEEFEIPTTAKAVYYFVNSDAVFKTYITTQPTQTSTTVSKATVYGNSNKIVNVAYVDNRSYEAAVGEDGTLTLDETVIQANSYPLYDFAGFYINDEFYAAGEVKNLTVTDDFDIYPEYTPKKYVTVNFENCYDNKNKGSDSISAQWDQKLCLRTEDADESTAWYFTDAYGNKSLINYGKMAEFYVSGAGTITAQTENVPDEPVVSVNYFTYEGYRDNTATAVCSYYLPEGCTFVEAGIILKTDTTTNVTASTDNYSGYVNFDEDALTTQSEKGVFKSYAFTDTNQYIFNVSRTIDSEFIMGGRAYLTYERFGETYTVYSDMRLIAYAV